MPRGRGHGVYRGVPAGPPAVGVGRLVHEHPKATDRGRAPGTGLPKQGGHGRGVDIPGAVAEVDALCGASVLDVLLAEDVGDRQPVALCPPR